MVSGGGGEGGPSLVGVVREVDVAVEGRLTNVEGTSPDRLVIILKEGEKIFMVAFVEIGILLGDFFSAVAAIQLLLPVCYYCYCSCYSCYYYSCCSCRSIFTVFTVNQ